ncbi:MAG: hypothetical protein A3B31_02700 [Candidatus Komeilibacteria bacterium RIFCSPLOWO2_01_FULL_53_11]|uniref:Uncharacterized protein n=1 Tax=Candidatus Komeilibacteria bacterium RIFCSPLOWO2_01_FULL_53_11 TaxID=1798552 RepID=A0A1G2BVA0_9BACT|nr:MAG: hypothetical protein A3B31_02700 [Candidatus Komeilibacteria bacterium RIFCSPLOWO2_01_FULL_53_11]
MPDLITMADELTQLIEDRIDRIYHVAIPIATGFRLRAEKLSFDPGVASIMRSKERQFRNAAERLALLRMQLANARGAIQDERSVVPFARFLGEYLRAQDEGPALLRGRSSGFQDEIPKMREFVQALRFARLNEHIASLN